LFTKDVEAGPPRGAQDGPAEQATFDAPQGVAVDPDTGDVFVADYSNHAIRLISCCSGGPNQGARSDRGRAAAAVRH
jgi:DNA-binding beta-propeller fold protein YncE